MAQQPTQRDQKQLAPAANGRLAVICLALIAVAILIAYWQALGGAFIWNDSDYVTNPDLRSLSGLGQIWFKVGATQQYYPLLHSFFWIQCQLWGDHPLGYHLVNLALHATSVVLLYLILRRLQIPGALLAAGIFALHPVMVESVAWITEQKNTLSTVFYLSALLVYLHFDQTRKTPTYAAALALYLLAMASKTVTATLPAALLVILWWQRGTLSWRRDIKPLAPWFVFGITAGLFTTWVELKYIGAEGTEFALSPIQRLLIAGQVPWFYASKLLWPTNLIFMYPRWAPNPTVWWHWCFPLASVAVCIVLWMARRKWRGPLAGWLLFIGTLVPVLGFLNVYWFVFSFAADHLQYLASLALIVLAAAAIALAISRLQPALRSIGGAVCVALLAILGALTFHQTEMYKNDITLYETTIQRNPACGMAYNNLGVELEHLGRLRESIALYRKAILLNPDNANAHYNLASQLAKLGQTQEAIGEFHEALRLFPNYLDAHNNLGILLVDAGRSQEAIEQFQAVLKINPNLHEVYFNLGNLFAAANRLPEAIDEYQRAVGLKSDYTEARSNLAVALIRSNRPEEAVVQFEKILDSDPDSAPVRANLAKVYALINRPTDALAMGQKALQLARSQHEPELTEQLESWLNNYRAKLSANQDTGSRPEPTSKTAPLEPAP